MGVASFRDAPVENADAGIVHGFFLKVPCRNFGDCGLLGTLEFRM
jgi:hypothetical protein